MLLGLHTYSLYLHGIGQDWAGFSLPWPRQMDVWQLMDYVVALGLEGLHIDDGAFDSLDTAYLNKVGSRARELSLYLEYNFSMDSSDYDPSLQHSVKEGVQIAQALGADIAKISMDIKRPRPLAASKFHPIVMEQLTALAQEVSQAAPMAEKSGIKIAIENHTDAFSEEVLWILDQVAHPFVGACVDTVNGLHVTENPMVAIENLAPRAVTNHFRNDRLEFQPYGFKLTGAATGDGDIDMKRAYELICRNPAMQRINIELEMEGDLTDMEKSLATEKKALKDSIRYCREVLGIGK